MKQTSGYVFKTLAVSATIDFLYLKLSRASFYKHRVTILYFWKIIEKTYYRLNLSRW